MQEGLDDIAERIAVARVHPEALSAVALACDSTQIYAHAVRLSVYEARNEVFVAERLRHMQSFMTSGYMTQPSQCVCVCLSSLTSTWHAALHNSSGQEHHRLPLRKLLGHTGSIALFYTAGLADIQNTTLLCELRDLRGLPSRRLPGKHE